MNANKPDSPYQIHALELGPMENFIYLITDTATSRAAVVDPAWDTDAIFKLAEQKGVNITDIILTHCHHDHINKVSDVLEHTDAQIHLSKAEYEFWDLDYINPSLHHGGDTIKLGNTDIEVLFTPGHSAGSACYKINNDLITGDTMFVFGCGHCKLPGNDPETLFHTLQKLKKLPGETVIHPGHNYAHKHTSTIAEQCEGNPFLHFDEVDKFVDYRVNIHDKVRSDPYDPVPREG
ncbi:MAG: MBL fold metallo-hydrolase [Gammaproteobacteria bacterium]|nr:MBL fold metallo-hydrolase [Gammaproteobacteria bacterium]